MSFALYRCFDKDSALIYVGMSISIRRRLSQHINKAGWFSEVSEIKISRYPDGEQCRAAEKHAIRNECPKYNIQRLAYTVSKSKAGR